MNHFPRYIVLFTFLLFSCTAFAQSSELVDEKVSHFPSSYLSSEKLVEKIEDTFTSDFDKARAAYAWIAMNVAYDTKAVGTTKKVRFTYRSQEELEVKKEQFRKELAEKTLKRKKALCEGYATLYKEMCPQMGIDCEIVNGTARRMISEIGNVNIPSNHAWNAIKIGNKWHLVDATWAAGSVDYGKMKFRKNYTAAYFASDPQKFIMKHFPDDASWQLSNKTYSKQEFAGLPIPYIQFLDKDIRLISPSKGRIEMKRGKEYEILIEGLDKNVQMAYHFKKEKYGQQVAHKRIKNRSVISVLPQNRGKDELVIYFNNEPALGFQVDIK